MGSSDCGVNSSAHKEIPDDLHEPGLDGDDQVVQNAVGDCLMEGPFITVGPQIEFEGFQFHAEFFGDVSDLDRGKIRLAGLGTEAGKLGAVKPDLVIPVRLGVWEGIKLLGGMCRQ